MSANQSLSQATLKRLLQAFQERGHFSGRRITIQDPENRAFRQTYEDLGRETPKVEPMALLTLFPEHSRCHAVGDSMSGLIVITHGAALRDIALMIERNGYEVVAITKDIK